MRAFTNERFIQRRAKIGQYVSWAGLAILAVGMVLSFRASPGTFTQVRDDANTIASAVAGDQYAIGYLDLTTFTASGEQLRAIAIDGVNPTDEPLDTSTYPLAGDGDTLVVIVNPQNTWIGEEGVSSERLASIFSTETSRWSEIDSTWPARPVQRYSPNPESVAFGTFTAAIMEPAYGAERGQELLLGTRNPNYTLTILGSFACLIVGFIAANVGGTNMRRFARSPRPDERLAKELKGFDDRYMLYSWMLPAPFVFAGPSGIYTFALRDQGGKISNAGSRWSQPFSFFRFLTAFGQEGLGNPTVDAQKDAKKIQDYLAEQMPDLDTEVQPLVLFMNPNVQLQLSNPDIPVIQPKSLKSLLRQRAKSTRLDNETLQQLETAFAQPAN